MKLARIQERLLWQSQPSLLLLLLPHLHQSNLVLMLGVFP
jgi:hypothetical protein